MEGSGAKSSKPALAAVSLAALAVAGCPTARRVAPVPAAPQPTSAVAAAPEAAPAEAAMPAAALPSPAAGVQRYRIDAAASLLVVVARRGGVLAAMGHDHVIASHDLSGYIDLQEPLRASRFALELPVAALTVDEPALRSGRGAGFDDEVPQAARAATRDNLLGERVLDAAHYPRITARGLELSGGPEHFAARVELTVRDTRHVALVPVRFATGPGDTLRITARFPLSQGALGLTPFSAALGALRVEDLLEVELDVSARRAP